jgi:hypothetical protein
MASTAEEAREKIKRIMSTTAATLFLLFQACVSVLVINLSRARRGQDFVGFCDVDKLPLGGLISTRL